MSILINPTTGEELDHSPASASLEEADAAIARAHDAFPAWRDVAPGERARLLRAFAAIVDAHLEELAQLEVLNAGHTIGNARWEAGNVRDCLNYYSAAPERLFGRQIPVRRRHRRHLPRAARRGRDHRPLELPDADRRVGLRARAGGRQHRRPQARRAHAADGDPDRRARASRPGLPEGVLTIIPGKGSVVGERFVTHPLVRKVCFTGSTGVGKQIMAGCADQVKRVTLELGGKSANIVFADTDVAAAAASAPYAVFDNAGQDCCARSRILVQRSAYDEFVGRLETAVRRSRSSTPPTSRARWARWSRRASATPCRPTSTTRSIAFTGSAPDGPGWWLPPTVVESRDTGEAVWREEVFGPVVAVMAFDDEDEAVALANDSDYGLSGSIFTSDVGRALRVARRVEAGNLSVNSHSSVRYWTPFGGYKQSGLGRELGPDAPNAFTEEKNVFIAH